MTTCYDDIRLAHQACRYNEGRLLRFHLLLDLMQRAQSFLPNLPPVRNAQAYIHSCLPEPLKWRRVHAGQANQVQECL
jgi:hypothetical protein